MKLQKKTNLNRIKKDLTNDTSKIKNYYKNKVTKVFP